MMKLIRLIVGKLILTWDGAFKPKSISRDLPAQRAIDSETKDWQLYQLQACPFCVKVRREMKRLALTIPLREINQDPGAHQALMVGGKIDQVPCLMIPATTNTPVQWIYESSDIIDFLRAKFKARVHA